MSHDEIWAEVAGKQGPHVAVGLNMSASGTFFAGSTPTSTSFEPRPFTLALTNVSLSGIYIGAWGHPIKQTNK